MHPTILAKRQGKGLERLARFAALIGERYELDSVFVSAINPTTKQPKVREMQRIEAVADLLEVICVSEKLISVEPVVDDEADEVVTDVPTDEISTDDEGVTTETVSDGDELPEPVVNDEADEGLG